MAVDDERDEREDEAATSAADDEATSAAEGEVTSDEGEATSDEGEATSDEGEATSDEDEAGAGAEAPGAAEPAADSPGTGGGGDGAPPASPTPRGRPAPVWVVPLYVFGLLLVYLGERVLSAKPTWHWAFTGTGLALVLVATAVRFSPRFRVGGERRTIERLLATLSITGLVALALYFATTDWGTAKLGLDTAQAVTRDRVEGVLTVLWIVLIGVSVVPMLFAEGALYPMRHAERPESRRVRAAAASGLMLVLAATYGALFVYAAQGVDLRVDYSYFKTSKPSASTRKMAKALDKPVKVIAFFPDVNDVRTEVKHYLDDVSRGIPKLQVQIKDRLLVPKLARKMHAMRDGIIVLAKGETTETLDIGTDMKDARPKLKTLDRDFQAKLLKLVRSRRTAYLTVGHGEISDAEAASPQNGGRSSRIVRLLLQRQNYLVKNLGLSQGLASDVPKDADLVLILGPSQPFAPEEIASLKRYVKRGGHLLMALDPDAMPSAALALGGGAPAASSATPGKHPRSHRHEKLHKASADPAGSTRPAAGQPPAAAPGAASSASVLSGLQALAHLVGLKLDPAILANDHDFVRRHFNASDRTLLVTNRFSSHASVSTLSRSASRGAAVVVFGTGSFQRASGSTDKIDFAVRSMPGTFADKNHDYRLDDHEKRSIYNIAAAVTAPAVGAKKKPKKAKKGAKSEPDQMRAFVVGDADAFSDLVLGRVMTNQLWFVDAVRWLGGEESFAGKVNTEEDIPIQHTQQKDLIWFYSTIFGAPALVLGLGLFFSKRSRRPKRPKRARDNGASA